MDCTRAYNAAPAPAQGLEDAISVSVVHPTWQRTKPDTDDEHTGWAFADPDGPPLSSTTGQHTATVTGSRVAVCPDETCAIATTPRMG